MQHSFLLASCGSHSHRVFVRVRARVLFAFVRIQSANADQEIYDVIPDQTELRYEEEEERAHHYVVSVNLFCLVVACVHGSVSVSRF